MEEVVPFVCAIIKLRLYVTNGNHEAMHTTKCDALRNLVPFVQFKKREKHPWMSVNFK